MTSTPAALAQLITYVESIGGTATISSRTEGSALYHFTVPTKWRAADGTVSVRPLNVGAAGYYTRDNGQILTGGGVARTYKAITSRKAQIPGYLPR